MGFINEQLDNFKAATTTADRFMRWAAESPFKRLLTLSFVGFVAVSGYIWYSYSLWKDAKNSSDLMQQEVDLTLQASDYKTVMEWAELCVASRETNLTNAEWYCEHAIDLYGRHAEEAPATFRQEIVDKEAYGAIIVDMSSQLRGLEMDRIYGQAPTEAQKLLDKAFSPTGSALFLGGIVVLMMVVALALQWYAGKQGFRRSARSESET